MVSVDADIFNPERDAYLAKLAAENIIILPQDVIEIHSADKFNEMVNQFPKALIIVTFSSPTCSACHAFEPIYKYAQKEYGPKGVIFARVNVMELPEIAEQFEVMGTPTTIFVQKKKLLQRAMGLIPPEQFRQVIQRLNGGNSDVDNLYM